MGKTTTLGQRLALIRGKRSQLEWSRQIKINQQNISRWEADFGWPHPDSLVRIADFENVSLTWLMTGQGPKETN